jgi:hypothetical protein
MDRRLSDMMRTTIRRVALLGLLATALSGCGGDTVVKMEQATQISKGWELKDLQKALEAGAITREEFDQIKQKLLKRKH